MQGIRIIAGVLLVFLGHQVQADLRESCERNMNEARRSIAAAQTRVNARIQQAIASSPAACRAKLDAAKTHCLPGDEREERRFCRSLPEGFTGTAQAIGETCAKVSRFQQLVNGSARRCRTQLNGCEAACAAQEQAKRICSDIRAGILRHLENQSRSAQNLLTRVREAAEAQQPPVACAGSETRSLAANTVERSSSPTPGAPSPSATPASRSPAAPSAPTSAARPVPASSGGMLGSLAQAAPLALLAMTMLQNRDQGAPADPMAKFCDENPQSRVCGAAVDCSDPNVASLNPVDCLCKDPAKARVTPICNQKPESGAIAGGFAGLPQSSGREGLLGASGAMDLLGAQNYKGGDVIGAELGIDAQQKSASGGGPNVSGGSPSPEPAAPHGGSPGSFNTDIMQGVEKGGGAGAGFGGSHAARTGEGEEHLEPFDLTRYLPQTEAQAREVAGMSIEAKDGLTGPLGPSIWEKVSRQYRRHQSFLKP